MLSETDMIYKHSLLASLYHSPFKKTSFHCAFWASLALLAFSTPADAQVIPCGTNAPIFDNSCTASSNFSIPVSGLDGTQLGTDIILQEVRFIITHTWNNDLDIKLISPSGVSIDLSTDNGSGADNYGDPSDNTCSSYTSLSMNACLSIEDGVAPFIGNYIPEEDFANFNDNSNPQGVWTLQACDDSANDMGFLHFAELVFAEMSCPPASALVANTITEDDINLSWTNGSTCVNTILEYGPVGFLPGTGASANEGIVINLSCPINSTTITGLDDLTTYDIYIREACSNGGFSSNSCPLTVTTACSTAPVSLLENFDTQTACGTSCGTVCPISGNWFNSTDDDFDWIVDGGGTGSSATGPSDDISGGGQYIYTEASGVACRNGKQAILESTCMLIDGSAGTCHLSFYHHLFGIHINELQLQITTNDGQTWLSLWSSVGNQGDRWEQTYIDLSGFNGLLAKFRFVAIGGEGIKGDMALDEITFYGTTPVSNGGNIFFADQDNDGFGDFNNTIAVCTQLVPSGYVTNSEDCDDSTNSVSPIALEIPCNDIDENCDGFLLQTLPQPIAADQIICIGTTATLSVIGTATGDYYWSDQSGNILFVGDTFQTDILTQTSNFWVQDSVVNICTSPRKMITVDIDPGPSIGTNDQPVICKGESFDLASLNIIDANNNVANISYHSAIPTSDLNELSSTVVSPNNTSTFYLQPSTINGCTSELPVSISVNDIPSPIITAQNNDLNICANELTTLTASEGGTGLGQITYLWDDGTTATERTILPANPTGNTTYFLQVTDDNNCTATDSIVINTLASITGVAIENITEVSSCNGTDGAITLGPVDGQAPFTYEWSGPVSGNETGVSSNFTLNNLSQGAYQITVTDASGESCHVLLPNIVLNGPGTVVDTLVEISAVDCFGMSDGEIDIDVSDGNPDFLWSNGETNEDLEDVPAGIYSVTITDGDCETVLSNLEISSPDALEIVVERIDQVSCFEEEDGAIDISVLGGTAPYEFEWSDDSETEDLDNLPTGAYELTVTDANDCSVVGALLEIEEPEELTGTLVQILDVSCFGSNDGAINYAASGGTAPYFYEWSNGMLTESIADLESGIYEVTITDSNGCVFQGDEIEVDAPSPLGINLENLEVPDCNELENGLIEVEISGGTEPYSYSWSNNSFTKNISNLAEGNYRLTVTDNQGCTVVSENYVLTAPEVLFFSFAFIGEESCTGVEDGMINLQISGGTEPYNYQWSTGQQTEDITNLSAGMYQLMVTDDNGCTKESSVLEVVALQPLAATVEMQSDISCPGANDGSVLLGLPDTGLNHSVLWSNGETTPHLNNLEPGTYQAEITAEDGCYFQSEEIVIEEPEPLELSIASVEQPSCNGFFDGSIDVAISGGTGAYSFNWNNGTTEEDLTAAPSGTYTLTAIDQNGCAKTTSPIQLSEPTNLNLHVQSSGVGCVDSVGFISAVISGGTAPYNFGWSTGSSNSTIENLPAGNYGLTATDVNGCILLASDLSVAQLVDTLAVNTIMESEISCYGDTDGVLSTEILGGNYPFQYNWSNGSTDSLNQNISVGNYTVTVTDNYGCVGVSELMTVAGPEAISYFVEEVTANLCLGDEEGVIALEVTGGAAPYVLQWSDNTADSTYVDNLATGSYYFTITDQNGCISNATQPITVAGPTSSVQAQLTGSESIDCFDDTDASLMVSPSGGTGNYDVLWNTGATTTSLENLGAGFYQSTITDQNGCEFITPNYEITGPAQALAVSLEDSQLLNNEFCNGVEGAINLVVEGGTMPYNYVWNNNALTSMLSDLPSGEYHATVTDANDCVLETVIFEITEPENTLSLEMLSTPDTNQLGNGTAAATITGGLWPYEFNWDAATGFQIDSVATGLSSGVYNITITDALQCVITNDVLVDTASFVSAVVYLKSGVGYLDYYPNPVSDILYVNVLLEKTSDLELRLITALGETVSVLRKQNLKEERLEIPVSLLPGGTYVLLAQVDGRIVLRELIVKQ
ncbi:MAG: T9SS type A sorting domain-containing protein [Saprospiraceae bacterium]